MKKTTFAIQKFLRAMRINSKNWCDIIFEGRNQNYGAYRIRRTSSRRHLLSFLITAVIAAFVVSIPKLIDTISVPSYGKIEMNDIVRVSLLDMEDSKNIHDYIPKLETPLPLGTTTPMLGESSDYDGSLPPGLTFGESDGLERKNIDLDIEIPSEADDMLEEEYIDPDKTYWVVEVMPTFPGGQSALFRFLTSNLNYPPEAAKKKHSGQVLCEFTINKDGSVSDIKIVSDNNPSLDREALRVLNLMPKWKPGERKGKPVRVRFSLPIVFGL